MKSLFISLFLAPYITLAMYIMSIGMGAGVSKYIIGADLSSMAPHICSNHPENFYVQCPLMGFTIWSGIFLVFWCLALMGECCMLSRKTQVQEVQYVHMHPHIFQNIQKENELVPIYME